MTLLGAPAALAAQRGHDLQVHALALVGADTYLGGGAGVGLRFGLGTRLAVLAGGGWLDSAGAAARVEALATYHLVTPGRPRPSLYGGGGVGLTTAAGGTRGQVVVVVGIETAPRGRGRWFLEAGVGGGVRLSAGYRITRFRPRR